MSNILKVSVLFTREILLNSKHVYCLTKEREREKMSFYESLTDLNRGYKNKKVSQFVQKNG
jgi:hypothetical protein